MIFSSIYRRESFGKILYGFCGLALTLTFSFASFAQKNVEKAAEDKSVLSEPAYGVKVTQIDDAGLKDLLKPNGKPLLVNFWATWCEPCREEFPDLVKIDQTFRGKIDFVTVSLDDPEELNDDVPKFLQTMKAEMPAFLLRTQDESEVISSIAKDWQGGLPFTILYNEKGETAYFKQGKVKFDILQTEIKKILKTGVSQTESPKP